MPTIDPEKLRAKAERRNVKRRANRAAAREPGPTPKPTPKPATTHRKVYQAQGIGSTPEGRAVAKRIARPKPKRTPAPKPEPDPDPATRHRRVTPKPKRELVFRAHPPPEWIGPDFDNPIMRGGLPLAAEVAACIGTILPLEELDTTGVRPEWTHCPTWWDAKWNNPALYASFGDPDSFKPTPDGFAIRREPGNGTPTERMANPFGNLRHRLYTFQDNYGETFVAKLQTASPGLWTMTREMWEPWGWIAERYQAFGYLDTLNREHLEHGREWKIRDWGPWWLTNVKGAFGPRSTWSKRPRIDDVMQAFKQPYQHAYEEANALWRNWLYFAADLCDPLSRSRIQGVMSSAITSSGSIVRLHAKADHSCIPGGVTLTRLLEVTVEWIARPRPPNSLMPCSNQFRATGAR